MKRLFGLLTAIALMVSMIPFSTFAAQADTERDMLIARACEVFPEYASKISTPPADTLANSRSGNTRELVHNETRQISDNCYMTYSEYTNGIVLLTESDYTYQTTEIDHQISGANTTVTVNIKAVCNFVGGYFLLSNVRYTISRSGYDKIDSAGTTTIVNPCYMHTSYSPILYETASQKAELSYRLTWHRGLTNTDFFSSVLSFKVGNNGAMVTHNAF